MLDGAEEVVPLALMALGLDPNTDSSSDFAKVKTFLLKIRPGVTTIDSSGYINDSIAGKIILSQGWNGDVRRIVQARKKQGDITPSSPPGRPRCGRTTGASPPTRRIRWPRTRGSTGCSSPPTAVAEMNYHNYKIPMPAALSQMPAGLKNDPLFNVPKSYTDNYKYILNVSPSVVNQRTQIYGEFKAA